MQKFNILVGAVVTDGAEALITQRSANEKFMPGAWGIPAGKINFGESLEDAVRRELKEETGLDAEGLRLVGYSMFMSQKGDDALHNMQINFEVRVDRSSPVVLDKSSQCHRWVLLGQLKDAGLDEFTMQAVNQVTNE